jgi:hypothetical protein
LFTLGLGEEIIDLAWMQKLFPKKARNKVQGWFDKLQNEEITTVPELRGTSEATWAKLDLPGAVRDTLQEVAEKAADTSTGAPFIPFVLLSPP